MVVDVMNEKSHTARALQLAERIDLKGLERPDQFSSSPLAFRAGGGTAVLFRFSEGCANQHSGSLTASPEREHVPQLISLTEQRPETKPPVRARIALKRSKRERSTFEQRILRSSTSVN
jgi:hypothetical protein